MSIASSSGSAAARRPVRRRFRFVWSSWPLPTAAVLVVLVAWELGTRLGVMPAEMPTIESIASWLGGQLGTSAFWAAVGQTMLQWSVGLLLGAVVGLAIGLTIGAVPFLYRLLQIPFEMFRPVPAIVYLPLVLLVMGAKSRVAILLAGVGALWPVMYQTYYGLRDVDPVARDTASVFGISGRRMLAWIVLPSLLPYLATGVRIASSLSLVIVIAIELIGGVSGLGANLATYQTNGIYPAIYGLIFVSGMLGLLLNLVLERIESSMLRWHPSHRIGDT